MHIKELIKYTVTMIAITNPFGNLAIFIGLTPDKTSIERKKLAAQTALATVITLIVVTWGGSPLLKLFGISIPAFEIGGGLVIILLGLSMLQSKKSNISHTKQETESAATKESIAVVPMAIPIIAGPGAMTTIIVYINAHNTLRDRLVVSLSDMLIALVIFMALFFAGRISRILGVSGISIAMRVMGLILIAMAMGMILNGIQTAFPALLATAHP